MVVLCVGMQVQVINPSMALCVQSAKCYTLQFSKSRKMCSREVLTCVLYWPHTMAICTTGRPWFYLLLLDLKGKEILWLTVICLLSRISSGQWWWGQRWWWHFRKASHEERVFSPQPIASSRGQWTWNDWRGKGVPAGVCSWNRLSIVIAFSL